MFESSIVIDGGGEGEAGEEDGCFIGLKRQSVPSLNLVFSSPNTSLGLGHTQIGT